MLLPFEIHEPASIVEASRLLRRYGEQATVYAGGTELLLVMKEGLAHYAHLVNVKTIPGLDGIALKDGRLVIGALATHHQVERSPLVRLHAPTIAAVAARVGNLRVRSVGTFGGNLCFAEPHSDPGALLVAWGADLVLTSERAERAVPAEAFFTGILQTVREPDEVLVRIEAGLLPPGTGAAYGKVAFQERPTAGVAVVVSVDGGAVRWARITLGSVGPVPARAHAAEESLQGRPPDEAVLRKAARVAATEGEVLEDLYCSVDYKRHLVQLLALRALREAVEQGARARGAVA